MELRVDPLPRQANSVWQYQVTVVAGAPEYWWDALALQNQMTKWLLDQNISHYHQGWHWWMIEESDVTMFVMRWA